MIVDECSTLLHNDIMVSYSTVQTSTYIIDQSLDMGILSHNYYLDCKIVYDFFIQVIWIRLL